MAEGRDDAKARRLYLHALEMDPDSLDCNANAAIFMDMQVGLMAGQMQRGAESCREVDSCGLCLVCVSG